MIVDGDFLKASPLGIKREYNAKNQELPFKPWFSIRTEMITLQTKPMTMLTTFFLLFLMIGTCSIYTGIIAIPTENRSLTWTACDNGTSSGVGQSNITVSPVMVPTTLSYSKQQSIGTKTDQDPVVIPTTVPITQTNVTFSGISVKPSILQIETYSLDPLTTTAISRYYYFQQLKVSGNCYVDWAAIFVEYLGLKASPTLENWTMSIFNSTLSPSTGILMPDSEISPTRKSFNATDEEKSYPFNYFAHWENVTLPYSLLNASKTTFTNGYYNFFVGIKLPRLSNDGIPIWYYCPDNEGLGVDAGKAYGSLANFSGPGIVRLYPNELPGIDFTLLVKLSPTGALSKPSDIGLRVNNMPVSTTGNGTGTFTTGNVYDPVNNQVVYNITSAWSDQFPATLQFTANFNYMTKNNFLPLVNAIANATAIAWNVYYSISGSGLAGKPLTIESNLPLSWAGWKLYNVTRSPWVPISAFTVALAPSGKFMAFKASGLFTGKFLLVAVAPIIPLDLSLVLAGQHLGVYQDLTGQVLVVHGPNGETMMLRSDYDGGVKNAMTIVGLQGPGALENLARLDGVTIRFKNDSKGPFIHPTGPFTFKSYINTSFDLFVNPPEGFRSSNLQDLELILDYSSFQNSWWIANATNASMRGNKYWNIDGLSLGNWLYRLINYDGNLTRINFTVDSVTKRRYSDFFINMSATVYNETLVPLNTIKSMALTFVMNFSYSNDELAILIKSQATGAFVQLNSSTKRLGYDNESFVSWTSVKETGISNISQYIKNDGKNTVEVMLRPMNKTYNINRLAKSHIFYANVVMLNFTYTNMIKNFTMQAYNQTSGKKLAPVVFTPSIGTSQARFNLTSLASSYAIFNSTTNSSRIFINATGIAPYLNTIYFDVDRIMLNITYKGFSRQTWNQSVYNAAGNLRVAISNTTLFNSPSNNMTIRVPFKSMIDFYDEYTYQVVWLNETDLSVATFAFTIDRLASTITSTSVSSGTSLLAGSTYDVQANLAYTGNGTKLANKVLKFDFHVLYRNGTHGEIIKTTITDNSGNAVAQLETADIMQSFTYAVNFTDTNPVFKSASVTNNQSITVLNSAEYVQNILVNYAYIIIPAIGLIIAIAIIQRSTNNKRKRLWKADANTIRDVVKIQHLLVIAKSGVCLVNRSYSQMQLDGDLISGFLNAISTFGKEVGGKGTGAKIGDGVVFDYQDFKILLQEGRTCQVALILNGVPSDNLKARAKIFIESFEQSYDMQDWRGNLDYFDGVDNYIEKAFEITLIYPLVVNQRKSKKEVKTGLGKALFEVGEAVQKEKQTFYLSTLLNYAQAGRKESQDHVLAEIYRLKREGFFTFYTPQSATKIT